MQAGINLFSLRKQIATEEDFLKTALRLKEMGYTSLQFSGAPFDAAMIARVSGASGLPVTLTHVPLDRVVDDTVRLAEEAEHQVAYGVVDTAPIPPWVISEIKKRIDLPVVATIISEKQDIDERIRAGADILNIAASHLTPRVVAHIRADYPEIPIIATGGPTDDSIRETIAAGANAITYTPPTNGMIFSESMTKYRDKYAKHDETNHNE